MRRCGAAKCPHAWHLVFEGLPGPVSGWCEMSWHKFSVGSRAIAVTAILGAVLAFGTISAARNYQQQADLLETEPAEIPAHPSLMAFALPRGAKIFSQNCAACHGKNGRGDNTIGAANLTDGDWLYGTGQINEIRQTVQYGIRSHDPRGRDLADMPAFARPIPYSREKLQSLSPTDISEIVEFLEEAQGRPANHLAAIEGRKIFDSRGGCWDCHGPDGGGDNDIGAPNLMAGIWLYGNGSRSSLFSSIADGHQGICPAWSHRLSPAEVLEVSLYVWSLSHPKTRSS